MIHNVDEVSSRVPHGHYMKGTRHEELTILSAVYLFDGSFLIQAWPNLINGSSSIHLPGYG